MTFDRHMGSGASKILTAVDQRDISAKGGYGDGLRSVMMDIAADLDEANTEGALGVTLRVTEESLQADFGWGGKSVMISGGPVSLRTILQDLANDIEDLRAAGVTFVPAHTLAKIPSDFLAGGRHLHRNPAFGAKRPDIDDGGVPSPGVGPDGVYDWILQPLNAVAVDIASIKAANGLTFTPRTVPIT